MTAIQPGIYLPENRTPCPSDRYEMRNESCTGRETMATMCVPSIEVLPDGTLQVNATWYFDYPHGGFARVVMNQIGEYQNAYLVDNLGNNYPLLGLSGAARDGSSFINQRTLNSGWNIFPPAQSGATSFILYANGQRVSIPNLVLR